MECVILAGGFGTRLQKTLPDCPKPMAPVAGRPFLEILLLSLARRGFDRAVLSLGFMAEKVVAHFGDRFAGIDLVYEIEKTPLDTGGALRQALPKCKDDHVFVLNGDTFLDLETAAVEAYWEEHRVPVIVAREVPDELRSGAPAGFLLDGGPGRQIENDVDDLPEVAARDRVDLMQHPHRVRALGQPPAAREIGAQVHPLRCKQ